MKRRGWSGILAGILGLAVVSHFLLRTLPAHRDLSEFERLERETLDANRSTEGEIADLEREAEALESDAFYRERMRRLNGQRPDAQGPR
jgi:hypothetical protein